METVSLPLSRLEARTAGPIDIITDDALARVSGVRVAFTGRNGGASTGAYEGLNLASHVGDSIACVEENRRILLNALNAQSASLVVPNQVHGDRIVPVLSSDAEAVALARSLAADGADAILVDAPDVAALLCFADCVPVIVVSPTGAFSVVHAGWRGVVAPIASKAVLAMAQRESGSADDLRAVAAGYNVYIGPHIRSCCFETGPEVRDVFAREFGGTCLAGDRNVSLVQALSVDLQQAGVNPQRIVDAGICTVCSSDRFYSYRASGGTCGRHGAIAFRENK